MRGQFFCKLFSGQLFIIPQNYSAKCHFGQFLDALAFLDFKLSVGGSGMHLRVLLSCILTSMHTLVLGQFGWVIMKVRVVRVV